MCFPVGGTISVMEGKSLHLHHNQTLVPKSETQGFDSWLTSSLRIECYFPLATSEVQMMSETKIYSQATNEQDKWYGTVK